MTTASSAAALTRPPMRLAGARAVFERDFLVFTSRPRFLLLRTLVVLLPAAVLLTVFGTTSGFVNSSGSSHVGQVVYSVCAVVVPGLVLLLAPVLAASCISSERAMNTLQIVLASPVSPFAFVFAKFASRLAVVLVLAFATLPLAGICFLFGGVSGGLFLELVAFAAGIAVLGTAAGIVASSWARSVAAAALSSYFLGIALPLLHLAGVGIVSATRHDSTAFERSEFLLAANPFFAWTKLAISTARGGTLESPGWTFLAWTAGFAVCAVAFGAWRVGRESAHEATTRGDSRAATPMRYENPVLDRALRGTLLRRPRWTSWLRLAFLLLVLGVILALAAVSHDLDDEWPYVTFLCITTLFVSLAAMTTASHAVAAERETGSLELLLATRLTTSDVVRGKFAATLLGVLPLFALALLAGVAAAAGTKLRLVTVLAWVVTVAVIVPFFTAVGLWCSATAATAGRAVLRAFALLIGGSVVHAVASGIVTAIGTRSGDSELLWFVWGASPFFVGGTGVIISANDHWGNDEGLGLLAWAVWTFVYAATTVVLVSATVKVVDRRNEAR